MLIGVVNYLPTRYRILGLPDLRRADLLLWGYLPWTEIAVDPRLAPRGSGWRWYDRRGCCLPPLLVPPRLLCGQSPWDRLWIDFRNAYGIVWSLRVEERLNASLAAANGNARLGWNGFVYPSPIQIRLQATPRRTRPMRRRQLRSGRGAWGPAKRRTGRAGVDGVTAEADLAAQCAALVALMRRFVSKEWIAARLED